VVEIGLSAPYPFHAPGPPSSAVSTSHTNEIPRIFALPITAADRLCRGVSIQQGAKLVGTGAVGNAYQGSSVALSADGVTAIVGGYGDNGFAGAAWVYSELRFAGTPGHANCYGRSVSALARQFRGLNAAAAALGFPSVPALQNAILAFCGG
jgi:hypothetical protein